MAQYLTARFYYYVMYWLMGIEIEVIDESNFNNKPFIAISNHQSALDILILGRMFPIGCTVTAKKSLKFVPFLGWFMSLSGTYFLDRSNRNSSVNTLNNGLKMVKEQKRALWIFPEGTRSYSTELDILPLKKGAFHLAQQGGIPVVPVVVSNTSTIFHPTWKVFNRGKITIKVMKPVPTDNLTKDDITQFSEKIRDDMIVELKKIGYSEYKLDTNLPPIEELKKDK